MIGSKSFVPYWRDEKDWACIIQPLPQYDDEERANGVDLIAFLFGYSQMTDTRMLALVTDKREYVYELLFSFSSEENKRRFFMLLQSNAITKIASDEIFVPTGDDIRDARPLAKVLPMDVVQHLAIIADALVGGSESQRPN